MPVTISKRGNRDNPDSFEQLFQLGLTYIQQLSGHIWTDYNTHDPGVTILEQVCFALTDLIYRSDFTVADYLTGPDGSIDYTLQGLAHPAEILQAIPQQSEDYRCWLMAALPELAQVSVQPGPAHDGIWQINARLYPVHQQNLNETERAAQAKAAIAAAYHQVRHLGEDLGQIRLITDTPLSLHATIDICDDIHDPNALAAMIYHQTSQWLQQDSLTTHPAELKAQLLAIADIHHMPHFELLAHGEFPEQADGDVDEDSLPAPNHTLPAHACLMIPAQPDALNLTLRQQGNTVRLDTADIRLYYQQLQDKNRPEPENDEMQTLPSGTFYDLAQYESVQQLFPRTYHLSAGHPAHYHPRQQSERHQLRSYLLLFDQLMANFCADLGQIRTLYSTQINAPHSYQTQPLTGQQFSHIGQHYPDDIRQRLRQLQDQFDNYPERKGRIFDYLLALYGESYPDTFHQQFNPYGSTRELQWRLLRHKQQFIRNIVPLTARRGLGPDLRQPHDPGGYARRLSLLLGLRTEEEDTFSRTITQYLLNVVSDDHFTASPAGQKILFRLQEPLLSQMEAVPERPDHLRLTGQQTRQIRAAVMAFSDQTIPQTLLCKGMTHHAYRILQRTQNGEYQLFLHFAGQQWLYIGRQRKKSKLIQFCHYLQQWLMRLNRESEGLYAVEHLLLRPAQTTDTTSYAHQVSIVLPGFTARHNNPRFRQQAEALIRSNSPAHLLIHVHWLSFYTFKSFEALYLEWRTHRARLCRQPDAGQPELSHVDTLAERLLQCLSQPDVAQGGLTL